MQHRLDQLTARDLAQHLNIEEALCRIVLDVLTEFQPDAMATLALLADGPVFRVRFAYGELLEVAWTKCGVEVSCCDGLLDQYFLYALHEYIIDPAAMLKRMARYDEMRVASRATLPRMLRQGLAPVRERFEKLEAGQRGLIARFVYAVSRH